MTRRRAIQRTSLLCVAFTLMLGWSSRAWSHCDSLDGPIVPEAREALETGDVTAVLKWVADDQEDVVRAAFALARQVRAEGPEARALADQFFLETLVRVHRQGEGAPYTGLKPAGSAPPLVVAADQALAQGDIERLVEHFQRAVADRLEASFRATLERRRHAGVSVEEGRRYVAEYVEFVHFVERLAELLDHAALSHGTQEHHR